MPAQPAPTTSVFVDALNKKFAEVAVGSCFFKYTYTIKPGRRFDKIIVSNVIIGHEDRSHSASVHAFVERATGRLVKAASFNAPATLSSGDLASKYNLSNERDFFRAVKDADQHGSYLYQ